MVDKKKEFRREFGGPIGCFLTMTALPVIFMMLIYVTVDLKSQYNEFELEDFYEEVVSSVTDLKVWKFLIVYFLLVAIVYALPAPTHNGPPVATSGKILKYKVSAKSTLAIFTAIYIGMYKYHDGSGNLINDFVYDNYLKLLVNSTVMAYIGQIFFLIRSYNLTDEDRNPYATTGNVVYDSFMGYELHPRLTELFDMKLYLYRYSMLGWVFVSVVNLMYKFDHQSDDLSTFLLDNISLTIMVISHAVYCYCVYFGDEKSCPFMFDIKYEGLGFAQTYGEVAIVPFIYTLPCYLCANYPDSGNYCDVRVAVATVMLVVSFYINAQANHQKTQFRVRGWKNYPVDDVIKPMTSDPQRAYYCGGWWGFSRHPNYLGEIMTSFGWSLLAGFTHPLIWFYPIFLVSILVPRIERLEEQSKLKFENVEEWKKYEQKVPYKVVPYLY